jgi:hypothetical protein
MEPAERTAWIEADRLFAELADLEPAQRAARLASMRIESGVQACLSRLLTSL